LNLPNGQTLIAGAFENYNGKRTSTLARLNADGTLDETFNSGGVGANGGITAMVLQSDGKILIGGSFTRYNGKTAGNIARINNDGSLDESFNANHSGSAGEIISIALQLINGENKILIGGSFGSYNGIVRNNIARLNEDGTIDNTFHYVDGANKLIYTIAMLNEKILIGGEFTMYNGITRNHYACLNADGTDDPSFRHFSGSNNIIRAITVQPTTHGKKILIGGDFTMIRGTNRWGIARLHEDGGFDHDFDANGQGTDHSVYTISLQSDGKILIGGEFRNYSNTSRRHLARLNGNGTLDTDFDPGQSSSFRVYAISPQSHRKILIGGDFVFYNAKVQRYLVQIHESGNQDFSYNVGSGANSNIYASALQGNKLLIGGSFTSFNNTNVSRIARLHEDGRVDTDFNPGGAGADDLIQSMSVLSNGQILINGLFTAYNGKTVGHIARLNANGILDESFNAGGSGANDYISSMAVLRNGKIVVTGDFTKYNDENRQQIAVLNPNGNLDTDFNPGMSILGGRLYSVIAQDDKIIIGGEFTSYNNIPKNHIARINPDGSLDATFNASTTNGSGPNGRIYRMLVQPDGKILLIGGFTTYNGFARNGIARIHADGSLDESFHPMAGPNDFLYAMALQPDGKILIIGGFTQYNNTSRIKIARLNSNGSLDESFNPENSTNYNITTLVVQEDGYIIIGGEFTSYNGTGRNRLARIQGDQHTITLQAPASTQYCLGSQLTVAYTKTGFYRLANQFSVQLSDATGSFANATTIGTASTTEGGNINATIPATTAPGSGYRIRVVSSQPAVVSASNAADITIGVPSSITTQPQPQTLCAGSAASFNVVALGSGLTYQWQKDGAAISGANTASYTIPSSAASNAGNYRVVVAGACGTATSQAVALTVNAMPGIPVITASGNTLSSSANSGNQWYFNGNAIASATNATYQVTASGTYTVQVSQNGCNSTSTPYQFVATAISGPGLWNGEVSIYPNPVVNQLNLRNVGGRKLSIQLIDIYGKTVRQWNTAQTTTALDVTGLASGVYQVVLTDAARNTTISQTIIKY
jgi:uncharacterized delta-60 repeat protein